MAWRSSTAPTTRNIIRPVDLLPVISASHNLESSEIKTRSFSNEEDEAQRGEDHRCGEATGSGPAGEGDCARTGSHGSDAVQLEVEVRRYGGGGCEAAACARG